jgi:hypothetical protein
MHSRGHAAGAPRPTTGCCPRRPTERSIDETLRSVEGDVVRGAQPGDERRYRELVGRYLRPALAVARELTETIEDAEKRGPGGPRRG